VPDFCARPGVERIDVAERRRDVHHPIDDDRRRLERFLDLGLENPRGTQAPDVAPVDLRVRIEARLLVVPVGEKKVRAVMSGVVELRLSDRLRGGHAGHRAPGRILDFLLSSRRPGAQESRGANRSKQKGTVDDFGHRRVLPDHDRLTGDR